MKYNYYNNNNIYNCNRVVNRWQWRHPVAVVHKKINNYVGKRIMNYFSYYQGSNKITAHNM